MLEDSPFPRYMVVCLSALSIFRTDDLTVLCHGPPSRILTVKESQIPLIKRLELKPGEEGEGGESPWVSQKVFWDQDSKKRQSPIFAAARVVSMSGG